MRKATYDGCGINLEWLKAVSFDECQILKNFFRDSGPQFLNMSEIKIEDSCKRLRPIIVAPGTILKKSQDESLTFYIILKGQVNIYTPKHRSSDETILLNEYWPGQSFCDPLLNETADTRATVTVAGKKPAKLFFLDKIAF